MMDLNNCNFKMPQAVIICQRAYQVDYAAPADLTQIVAIYNQGIGTANADLEPVSVASRQLWFEAHSKSSRPLVVLRCDGVVVAWASLSDLYERPAYRYSTEISIYVDRGYSRQGLGDFLLRWLIGLGDLLGVRSIVALIFGHNTASINLFKKHGFGQWGHLPKVCLSMGNMADVVILGLTLQEN